MVAHAGRCRVLQWLQQFLQIHQQVLLYSEQIAENGKFSNRQAANYVPLEFQREIAARV